MKHLIVPPSLGQLQLYLQILDLAENAWAATLFCVTTQNETDVHLMKFVYPMIPFLFTNQSFYMEESGKS
jgi:hypothetical protein